MLTPLAAIVAILLALAAGQGAGTLRVRVVLLDASGVATPIPRLTLLVSDNPPIDEPRRVRTTAEGSIELKLPAGSYTVELDEPIGFRGKAYTWTQIVEVVDGRDTVLDLNTGNAEEAGRARVNADSATLLTSWRDSVVEIWTPTRHASGFVVDAARGLIATSHRAMGSATSVEVELTSGRERFKVAGRVVVSERDPGAAIVWINPEALKSTRALHFECAAASRPEVNYKDIVSTITASMFANKEMSDGIVTRTTAQAIFSDMRIGSDSEGGPVFEESGALVGISAIDPRAEAQRWNEAWVVPAQHACKVLAAAVTRTAAALPPPGTRLPLDPTAPAAPPATTATAQSPAPTVSASTFDITLLTPARIRNNTTGPAGFRSDFGSWTDYVREVGHVVLVRVSPQFEESLWKTLARGAAATQGVMLPALKSLTANFQQLRAYCGNVEVLPIHPFIIEYQIAGRSPVREGLYVFEPGAFGPHCASIRLSLFSEKEPQRAVPETIDPKLFDRLKQP